MAVKTYNYIYGGIPGSVDVDASMGSCVITSVGDESGHQVGVKTITVELSEALPFELNIRFLVDIEIVTAYGTDGNTFPINLVMPIGTSNHVFYDNPCFEQIAEPFSRETRNYSLSDQAETQVIGGSLTASVTDIVNVSCFGLPTGAITIEALGGSGGHTYEWSDGGPDSPYRSGLPAGTYSVTVRDGAMAEVVLSGIVLSQPSQIQLNPTITPIACFGGSSGAIATAPSGGSGSGYSFSWSDGSSAQNRTSLTAGSYQVTVTDSAGCSRLFTIEVTSPAQITITVNKTGKNITNVITGGTAPFTYLWSDGVVLKDRTNIPNGVYSFTVTDANGCQQITTIVIQDFKFFLSKNPIWLKLATSSMVGKDNLSFVCQVYLEDIYQSDSFNLKYSAEQPSRVDGTTDFNVEQVLNSFLDSYVPEFGHTNVVQVAEAFKRFYLSYFEKYGTPPEPDDTTTNETFYVLFGGLSEQEFAKQTFFDSYLDVQKPFLSWVPHTAPIATDQHSYLHFVVNNQVYPNLTLKATVYYTDNTSTSEDVKSVLSTEPFEVYRFPAGIAQLGLQTLNPTKTIAKYDLQLFSGETELSEKRTFEVYGAKRYYRKLLFLNSLGGWDHVLCFGRGKQSLRTSEDSIARDLPVGYLYSDREEETVTKMGQLTGQLVIATLNGYQRKYLIDLAISEKVYEQTATGYLPVKVKFDFDPQDDFENLDEIGLDIIYPPIRRYTPEL
ncbi:SprB repeat-containing protein [Algoriphagus resistens]|uniref:SprB repeat-containing protein n=1 Tax=Algoriphagus resistens TaxID=1750590 RepID=UPI000716C326|nr:SprB repeat-containing protein [Algoriphagus resistens]